MQFTLSSVELSTALKAVSKAISPRPIHSMLSNVLIKTEDNCLVISATDLTTFISLRIPANIIEHGLLCVPFFLTNKMIEVLPSCELTIKSDKDSLIEQPSNLVQFPSNATVDVEPTVTEDDVTAELIKEILDRTDLMDWNGYRKFVKLYQLPEGIHQQKRPKVREVFVKYLESIGVGELRGMIAAIEKV